MALKKKKKKDKTKNWDTSPLSKQVKKSTKVKKTEIQKFKKEVEEHAKKDKIEKNTIDLLELYKIAALQTSGNPSKELIVLYEQNAAIRKLVVEHIEKDLSMTQDEDGINNGPLDPVKLELMRKYMADGRVMLKEISAIWDEVSEKEIDYTLVEAYKKIFLKILQKS